MVQNAWLYRTYLKNAAFISYQRVCKWIWKSPYLSNEYQIPLNDEYDLKFSFLYMILWYKEEDCWKWMNDRIIYHYDKNKFEVIWITYETCEKTCKWCLYLQFFTALNIYICNSNCPKKSLGWILPFCSYIS